MFRAEGPVVCLAQANGLGVGKTQSIRAEGPVVCQIAGPSALTSLVSACHPGGLPGLGKWLGLWPEIHHNLQHQKAYARDNFARPSLTCRVGIDSLTCRVGIGCSHIAVRLSSVPPSRCDVRRGDTELRSKLVFDFAAIVPEVEDTGSQWWMNLARALRHSKKKFVRSVFDHGNQFSHALFVELNLRGVR